MIDEFERHCWIDVFPPEDLETYAKYRRPRTLGQRPALLLIDLYNAVYGDRREPLAQGRQRFPSHCGLAAWDALEPTQALLARARQAQLPIFHTTVEARPEAVLERFTATKRPPGQTQTNAVWNYTFVEPLAPVPGEVVIYKQRASGFFGTPLEAHLRMLGVDTLLVAGESTSGCVRASVVDAYSHGFQVGVVEECTFDRSELCHKVNLFDLHHKYADVLHLEAALAYLDEVAAATSKVQI
ncbi:MAG: isochorismatase family protein [Chloroflexi bacterium]|nr:isochorismatase family protein [Chloroflexota bacterium]